MTELTPGKRYRWTVEGTVYGSEAKFDLPYGFTVSEPELLPDPLPITPGSVVRTVGGMKWLTDRGWTDERGAIVSEEFVANKAMAVLFDAGADRA